MSTIHRNKDGQPIERWFRAGEDKGGPTMCGAYDCGRKADAEWMLPDLQIHLCYWHAIKILPAMIADAMAARPDAGKLLTETHRKMNEVFWRAAALALAREPKSVESEESEERLAYATFCLEREMEASS